MVKDDQSTFISHRFLWAVGLSVEKFPPGSLLGDRYRVVESQIVSDNQIFKLPEIPDEIPTYVSAYLKLARLPLHMPRPYGTVKINADTADAQELLLLDRAPICAEGKLYPNIQATWNEATAIRQINLMGQMLQLWQPLLEAGMAGTLVDPEKLRVFGTWIRVLELIDEEVQLSDLGSMWVDWLEHAKPEIGEPLADFCFGLSRGELDLTEAIATLDRLAQLHSATLNIRIASGTDKGPRRDHNEDNCYPIPSAQRRSQQSRILCDKLAIICDGLGGHEGGEIASAMAIKTIETELTAVLTELEHSSEPFDPDWFIQKLDQVTRTANDQIVSLNDQYQKQAQQRMGTTLVMAVIPHPHEVYIVNIGDSRLYWIDDESFDQVTIDDDVSVRDVILGYSFYAHAAQRIDGGSLIQALGTRSSEFLFPRIQRLPLDRDCLLLLCSDGLSDYDRIEEIMELYIRPILTTNLPLHKSVTKLIDQANERNGHDNVTVALMRCQGLLGEETEESSGEDTLPIVPDALQAFSEDNVPLDAKNISHKDANNVAPSSNNLKLVIGGIVVLVVGAIAFTQISAVKTWLQPAPITPNQNSN